MKRKPFKGARFDGKLFVSKGLLVMLVVGFALVGAYLTFPTKAAPLNGHEIVLDGSGKIIPWGTNPANTYDDIISRAWNYLINDVPDGIGNNEPAYISHCCVMADTNTPSFWENNPAGNFAMLIESATKTYSYKGDARPLSIAREVADHMLDNGMTPSSWNWGNLAYATEDAGNLTFNGGGRGDGNGVIEPDKSAEFAYGLLTLYRYNGDTRYRDAAINSANVLAARVRAGNQSQSPWPFRVNAQSNAIREQYTAHMLPYIQLFDELNRLGLGNTSAYQSARNTAWNWMMTFPMQNNVWTQYFEDVWVQSDYRHNLNQLIPMNTAKYLMEHPELDPNWQAHVRSLISFVEQHFAVQVFGANAIGEQTDYNLLMGSHTARYASVNALLYEKTGDTAAKEKAYRAFNWATYMTLQSGLVKFNESSEEVWFTDGYGDYIKHFIAGMGAVPEWAPANQNRMTRTTSVVKSVTYSASAISYVTSDSASQEVFRLNTNPASVTAGGQSLAQRGDLNQQGWTYDATSRILRIRHDSSASIQIVLGGQSSPAPVVTLSANPTQVVSGSASMLSWTVLNTATSCTASNGWSGQKNISGSSETTGNLTANRTYALQCTGPGGASNTASVTVTVTATPPSDVTPPAVSMTLPGVTVPSGQPTVLVRNLKSVTWQPSASDASGIRTLTLTVNGQTVNLMNGSYIFGNSPPNSANGDYELRVVATDNNNNSTTAHLNIQLRHPDFNRSGRVDVSDLGALTQRWSFASTNYDLNANGRVDVSDLGYLLQRWMSTQ